MTPALLLHLKVVQEWNDIAQYSVGFFYSKRINGWHHSHNGDDSSQWILVGQDSVLE